MDGEIFAARVEDIEYIKFRGIVRYSHCGGLESHIDQLFERRDFSEIVIDLEDAEILDSTALGLLARLAIELKKHSDQKPVIFLHQGELSNILSRVCFDQVFNIIFEDKYSVKGEYKELLNYPEDEKQVLQRVIDAHRNLAELDKGNEELYRDITSILG